MIRIVIERERSQRIAAYTVSGHALYAEPGKDVVCAGVSSVAFGTVNAIEALTGATLSHEVREGYLHVSIPQLHDSKQAEHVQLLLESMRVMLETIEHSYGDFVRLKVVNKGG